MNCPRCGVGGQLANVKDALLINKGPEGPLNIVVCLRCKTVLVGTNPVDSYLDISVKDLDTNLGEGGDDD